MGLHTSLCVFMDFSGSLSVLIVAYASLWVLIGFDSSLCLLMDP